MNVSSIHQYNILMTINSKKNNQFISICKNKYVVYLSPFSSVDRTFGF